MTAAAIEAWLPEIRKRRFALDGGVLVARISALAVPILPKNREAIASTAINMTSARLQPKRLKGLIDLLRTEVRAFEELINPLDVAFPYAALAR